MKSDLSSGFLWAALYLVISAIVARFAGSGLWLIATPALFAALSTGAAYRLMRGRAPWRIVSESKRYPIVLLISLSFGLFAMGQIRPMHAPVPMRDGMDLLAACISMVFLGPICEEIFFRGLLLSEMGRTELSFWVGAGLFAIAHLGQPVSEGWGQLLFALVAGVIFGKIVQWTGSLFSSIIVHAIANALTILVWAGWIQPPSIPLMIALLICGGCAFFYLDRSSKQPPTDFFRGLFNRS